MVAIDQDFYLIRSALEDLNQYLLSKELFWPLSVPISRREGFSSIRITPGNLLLARARLAVQPLSPSQQTEREQLEERFGEIHDRWKANWELKAEQEVSSRLTMWQNYLEDCRNDPGKYAPDYAWEVRWRVVIHLIEIDIGQMPEGSSERLELVDQQLQSLFQPGEFIWSPALEKGFPVDPYWYLYGMLRTDLH